MKAVRHNPVIVGVMLQTKVRPDGAVATMMSARDSEDDKLDKLVTALEDRLSTLVDVLAACGEQDRANKIRKNLQSIQSGRHQGLHAVRTGYHYNGGSGSLNDLFICIQNGHSVNRDDQTDVNETLQAALHDAEKFAKRVSAQQLTRVRPRNAT